MHSYQTFFGTEGFSLFCVFFFTGLKILTISRVTLQFPQGICSCRGGCVFGEPLSPASPALSGSLGDPSIKQDLASLLSGFLSPWGPAGRPGLFILLLLLPRLRVTLPPQMG